MDFMQRRIYIRKWIVSHFGQPWIKHRTIYCTLYVWLTVCSSCTKPEGTAPHQCVSVCVCVCVCFSPVAPPGAAATAQMWKEVRFQTSHRLFHWYIDIYIYIYRYIYNIVLFFTFLNESNIIKYDWTLSVCLSVCLRRGVPTSVCCSGYILFTHTCTKLNVPGDEEEGIILFAQEPARTVLSQDVWEMLHPKLWKRKVAKLTVHGRIKRQQR